MHMHTHNLVPQTRVIKPELRAALLCNVTMQHAMGAPKQDWHGDMCVGITHLKKNSGFVTYGANGRIKAAYNSNQNHCRLT